MDFAGICLSSGNFLSVKMYSKRAKGVTEQVLGTFTVYDGPKYDKMPKYFRDVYADVNWRGLTGAKFKNGNWPFFFFSTITYTRTINQKYF